MEAKKKTFEVLDRLPVGVEFTGIQLANWVRCETGEIHYPDTTLRYLRYWRRERGRMVISVNRHRSIYKIVA